jgi:hypothetical protein
MPNTDPNITAQIETFTGQIMATVEAAVAERIQAALAGVFGVPQKRGPGRPPKHLATTAPLTFASVRTPTRKKQLCPVPGCTSPAAPVFGMVCKQHKNVAKAKIKKYREARREGTVSQATGARPATPKKMKKATPKEGAEASRAVPGCLEIAQRRGPRDGEEDRSGEGRRRGREALAVAEEVGQRTVE